MKKEEKATEPPRKSSKTGTVKEGIVIQEAEKIYNIEHIETANFGFVASDKVFNQVLTKELLLAIRPYHKDVDDFIKKIPKKFSDTWEVEKTYSNQAKSLIEEHFVWVLGWQLRRLFAIGNKTASPEQTDDYLDQCLLTFKLTLQLINFSLLSQLWDIFKVKKKSLASDKSVIDPIFSSEVELRPDQLVACMAALLNAFLKDKITLPFKELKNPKELADPKGSFLNACKGLDEIREIYSQSKHKPEHCFIAEEHLATVLTSVAFLSNYQLVSMKKIEYEWPRNNDPRYIRDFNILGKRQDDSTGHLRLLKYSTEPFNTFAVFLREQKTKINLFPFVMEFNSLTDEDGSKIAFLEHKKGRTELNYTFVDDGTQKKITFTGVIKEGESDQIIEDSQYLALRFDGVIAQFLDAKNTILGSREKAKQKKEEMSDFDNL